MGTVFIPPPDATVGRIRAASQQEDRCTFLTWWGERERPGGDAETRARGGAGPGAPHHPTGPAHRWGALHARGSEASRTAGRNPFTSPPHMTNLADVVTACGRM